MSREQEESKRRQKRGRHTQCEHIHAFTHTDKAQLKLMRSERNTQTESAILKTFTYCVSSSQIAAPRTKALGIGGVVFLDLRCGGLGNRW